MAGTMTSLPERLVDTLALDTTDYQDRGWSRPRRPAKSSIRVRRRPPRRPPPVSFPAPRRRTGGAENGAPGDAGRVGAGERREQGGRKQSP